VKCLKKKNLKSMKTVPALGLVAQGMANVMSVRPIIIREVKKLPVESNLNS